MRSYVQFSTRAQPAYFFPCCSSQRFLRLIFPAPKSRVSIAGQFYRPLR